jgi:hypothetical protein
VGPDNEPSIGVLAGIYTLSPETKADLEQRKIYAAIPDSKIVLNKDLTLSISDIPDCFGSSFRESKGQFLNAVGTWRVVVPEIIATYGIDINIVSGGTLRAGTYASHILFKESSAPFKLHLIIGDPDARDELVYEKTF